MKKSLLALAVVFAASSATASAATVYDKDGTTLTVVVVFSQFSIMDSTQKLATRMHH